MSILLLRLSAPIQSWGESSRFGERDTRKEPTKSGVLGLVCAALGKPREEFYGDGFPSLEELGRLKMVVRVEQEGNVERDFQTAGGGQMPGERRYGVAKADPKKGPETVISNRYYLTDAIFLVALEGDRTLLEKAEAALKEPVWPLFLGRRAFPPTEPILLGYGVIDDKSAVKVVDEHYWLGRVSSKRPDRLRIVEECGQKDGSPRRDVPLSFEKSSRRYAVRYVTERWIATPKGEGESE